MPTIPPPPKISAYTQLPTLQQWKKDSYVGNILGPKRSNDPVLIRIDRMVNSLNRLSRVNGADDEYLYRLGGLFHTTMYWNNNHKFNQLMDSRRRTSIMRLNLCAANKLARILECGIGGLAAKLQEIFGKGMSEHGFEVDNRKNMDPNYMSPINGREGQEWRGNWKIMFRAGIAWRFDKQKESYVRLNTSEYRSMETHIGNREGAGYVFSMSNELFISGFTTIKELGAQFHSSFMAGRPVQCAGMISAENGIITKINNASGHYKPVDLALAKLLRHLKTVGVNIRKIDVWEQVKSIQDDGYQLDPRTRGDAFLSANGNWDAIKKSGSRYEGDNSAF